jgi:hypothetical protein
MWMSTKRLMDKNNLQNSDAALGLFPPEVKRTGREADHSPPTSADVKNSWI